MENGMNRERLELLIDVLSKVPTDKFNMNTWVACALGWAALDPRMNAQGLVMIARVLSENGEDDGDVHEIIAGANAMIAAIYNHGDDVIFLPYVKDTNMRGYRAASMFFDLRLSVADDLFSTIGYNTTQPKIIDVINKIEDLLQHGE
jgi:hypothetical protein